MSRTIALLGQPNSGKSTVFNGLTGAHQHVGNWPGKTVERKEGDFTYQGESYRVIDLPGSYIYVCRLCGNEYASSFSSESDGCCREKGDSY